MTAASINPRRNRAVPIVHVGARLAGADANDAFNSAMTGVLRWMQSRMGISLPDGAWNGEAFRSEGFFGLPAETIRTEDTWATRVDRPDRNVPERRWITECLLIHDVDSSGTPVVNLQARVTCATTEPNLQIGPAVPGFVRALAHDPGFIVDSEWVPARDRPIAVGGNFEFDELLGLLLDSGRRRNVILARHLPDAADEFAIDLRGLAERLCGVAHVVALDDESSERFANELGREWRMEPGAVRTFHPGFQPDSESTQHPWINAHRIDAWRETRGESFEDHLARGAAMTAVRSVPRDEVLFFSTLRRHALSRERKSHAAGDGSLEALRQENDYLARELESTRQELDEIYEVAQSDKEERESADAERDEAQLANHRLRARIQALEHELNQRHDSSDWREQAVPASLGEIEEWATSNLAGRVHIENRAIRETRRSPYEHPSIVYRSLLLLANSYYPMRLGQCSKDTFIDDCRRIGVEHSLTGRSGQSRQYGDGDKYFVRRHGQSIYLNEHLKKGDVHGDDRLTMRIYFVWDEDNHEVVVGWMPSHLRTAIT